MGMTDDKRFTFIKDTVATNLKTPIVYNNEKMSIGEVLEMLNNLYDENEQLKNDCGILVQSNQDYRKENEQLKSFKNDVHDLINELIKKAEKDVEDLRKDAYEKGYAYNPYYYWEVAHGLEKLKKELKEWLKNDYSLVEKQ